MTPWTFVQQTFTEHLLRARLCDSLRECAVGMTRPVLSFKEIHRVKNTRTQITVIPDRKALSTADTESSCWSTGGQDAEPDRVRMRIKQSKGPSRGAVGTQLGPMGKVLGSCPHWACMHAYDTGSGLQHKHPVKGVPLSPSVTHGKNNKSTRRRGVGVRRRRCKRRRKQTKMIRIKP